MKLAADPIIFFNPDNLFGGIDGTVDPVRGGSLLAAEVAARELTPGKVGGTDRGIVGLIAPRPPAALASDTNDSI
jgi:hypothetical protein